MKTKSLFLLPLLALAAPCAGLDFSDEFRTGDDLPDGLNPVDSITIGAEPLNLNKVSFDFSAATGSANVRWFAFWTNLDDN
jgi:hypothetical protein|tara:strand:- start:591 stop:833 length:243 start_codon:yes stop_codon:yes gene_type:complete